MLRPLANLHVLADVYRSPLTWPFAIIPILPNFPLFYVLWRAWSHYKAWKGALYLEQLLQRGMIVEQPSKDLDAVYEAKGVVVAPEGSENSAPDSTVSGAKSPSSTKQKGQHETVEDAADELVKQAKGETGAPDGTATPKSMVFDGKSEGKPTPASSSEPAPRHPSVLLATNQVPMLARKFDLRSLEVLDITRAVEQAGIRARRIDKANIEKSSTEGEKA